MLTARINNTLDNLIIRLADKNIFTYRLGVARSILAFSTLLTFIGNDPYVLFSNSDFVQNTINKSQELILEPFNFFVLLGVENIKLSFYLSIGILMLTISGWRPRYTCVFHFWICASFKDSSLLIDGGDQIASNLSLMLIPILLFDDRKWHWQADNMRPINNSVTPKILISNFFLMIIKLQMCLIYFHAAVGKLPHTEWANGTAVYYWFNDPVYGMKPWLHPVLDTILSNAFGVALISWGAIFLEVLLFMAILMNSKAKLTLLVFGITFHFFIILIHGLISFFFTMSAGLLLYLWIDNKYGRLYFLEKD